MNKIIMLDKNNYKVDAKLVFSFTYLDKKYAVLEYAQNLFAEDSKYSNLNIFEISKVNNNKVYLSDIEEENWEKIKDFLQKEIF